MLRIRLPFFIDFFYPFYSRLTMSLALNNTMVSLLKITLPNFYCSITEQPFTSLSTLLLLSISKNLHIWKESKPWPTSNLGVRLHKTGCKIHLWSSSLSSLAHLPKEGVKQNQTVTSVFQHRNVNLQTCPSMPPCPCLTPYIIYRISDGYDY